MDIRNFNTHPSEYGSSHEGKGEVKNVFLYNKEDFESKLKFIIYTEIKPGDSIGYHKHGQNEEIYVILEGSGKMQINDEDYEVKQGDVIVNKKEYSHSLENNSEEMLKILVFEADI